MKRDLIGNVRSVRTERAEWDLTNELWLAPTRTTIEEYRSDGQIESSEYRFGDGVPQRVWHSYDDAGLMLESRFQSGDAESRFQKCFYDDCGRLIRCVGVAPDGSEVVGEERSYGADGRQTSIVHLPPMEGSVNYFCPIAGVNVSTSAVGVRTMITEYGAGGVASEVLLRSAEGDLLRRFVVTRDDAGELVKTEVILGADPLLPDVPGFGVGAVWFTEEYTNDEQGRRVELRRLIFGLCDERETYRYDEHGNRTETSTERSTVEGTLGEDGVLVPTGPAKIDRDRTRMVYKYDARGNWVERVTSQRHGENPDFTPCSVERRQISYLE